MQYIFYTYYTYVRLFNYFHILLTISIALYVANISGASQSPSFI